jgi:rubredoxin
MIDTLCTADGRKYTETTQEVIAVRQWECVICGYVYDEAKGIPDEGIAPGTRWEDIPDDWECPDCGVSKSDFEMIQFDG